MHVEDKKAEMPLTKCGHISCRKISKSWNSHRCKKTFT